MAVSGGMVLVLFRYMQKVVMTDPECVPAQAATMLYIGTPAVYVACQDEDVRRLDTRSNSLLAHLHMHRCI